MKLLSSEKGATLLELMIAIALILFLIASLLPTAVQFRKREMNWRQEIKMEQEAIRFFTYLENRNAHILGWNITGSSVTFEVNEQRTSSTIKRYIYKDGDRIAEVDSENRGYLILANMVQDVRFYSMDNGLHIELTLSTGEKVRIFHGVLYRSIEL